MGYEIDFLPADKHNIFLQIDSIVSFVSQRQDGNSQTFSQRNFDEKQVDEVKKHTFHFSRTGERSVSKGSGFAFWCAKKHTFHWKRNKTKLEEAYHVGLGNKRMRPEKYEDLNKALMKWFLNCRSENIPLNEPLLKEKAIAFATELKIENFQASDGWLEKWKKRFVYFLLFFLTAFGITVFVIHL